MVEVIHRRHFLLATMGALGAGCAASRPAAAPSPSTGRPSSFAEVEARIGGRVGVFALHTGTGRTLERRADERFAMCSTFKWVLVAALLARVDRGELSLDERVPYGSDALLEHAPITREHVAEGFMTIGALGHAAITRSDNTAANLLLPKAGGPPGVTQFIRSQGDLVTRVDRNEPTVNDNAPGDPRDTTSPRAMVGLMRKVLLGDALSSASRERLLGLLRANETGKARLRAGMPPTWTVGDKTGSGGRCAVNDVAIAWPPGSAPILVASYTSDGEAGLPRQDVAQADIGRIVARDL